MQNGDGMGYIDIHSHILPGLDDGSRSIEQSLEMLRIAYEEGIDIIIATPHNMPGKGQPPLQSVIEQAETLQQLANQEEIPIDIVVGTEYYFREKVLYLLEEEAAITMNASEFVLVEFEPMVEKIYFRNAIRDILSTGYRPIVAHVERYANVMRDKSMLHDLKKMGALIQVNAASVIGDNGRVSKKDVKRLLKERLVDFVATDAHSDGRRAPFMHKCATYLYKKYDAEYVDELLFLNAEKYLLNH